MGLGLTISKMIVQQLEGDIMVVSEKNKGTKFSFTVKLDPIEEKTINERNMQNLSFLQ